jgi:hypothetical protein
MSKDLKQIAAEMREREIGAVGVLISAEFLELEPEARESAMIEALNDAFQSLTEALASSGEFKVTGELPDPYRGRLDS